MKFYERQKAINLRSQGYSLREISNLLGVAKSTASLWVRNVYLSASAKKRLLSVIEKGQYVAAENKKSATLKLNNSIAGDAKKWLASAKISKDTVKLVCAMIYWCEGAKDYHSGIAFTNSDPNLTRFFVDSLEQGFNINRSRAVAVLHLHGYHNPITQRNFWAKTLMISKSQFRKPYLKSHTGIRVRTNYPGCISLRYYDSILARKLMALAQEYIKKGV